MPSRLALVILVSCLAGLVARPAHAETPVSIELVLAVDTSLSISDFEFSLQMKGIAEALRSKEVIELISVQNGVAMTLIQWAGWTNEMNWIPWRLLKTRQSVLAFAAEIEAVERDRVGYLTGIGTAVEAGLRAIATNRFAGRRRKIDVSGDGRNNAGRSPLVSRIIAQAQGVTINGLAILTDVADLDVYYRQHVISGPHAFVLKAGNYDDFARAMRLKLLRELAPAVSGKRP